MGDVLTIQGQTVKFPFKCRAFYHFCPYFSTCPFLKSGRPTPIKIIFSNLLRTDLLIHKVYVFEVENWGLWTQEAFKIG